MSKDEKLKNLLLQLDGGIIVSCQSKLGDPTHSTEYMGVFAECAMMGGASGLRINSAADVEYIKKRVNLPIIGIWKRPGVDEHGIMITPTFEDARQLVEAGADLIALDTTARRRQNDEDVIELVYKIQDELNTPVMADCHIFDDAVRTSADIVAPTLSLSDESDDYTPDFTLIETLIQKQPKPVIAEGRFWNPEDISRAFQLGVHAIVIGSAVTRPWLITERFVRASRKYQHHQEK